MREIEEEFPSSEQIKVLEQQIKHMRLSQGDINGRIDRVEKDFEDRIMNNDIQNDLSQLKKLSYSVGQINDSFKDDVFRLENKIKDNSMRLLEFDNNITTVKADYDQKHSKLVWENSEHLKKISYLEELFNEMYEVIKKHNMLNEHLQQNSKSRPDLLSASYYSKASD
jgi:archaellum component FlaC